MGYKNLQNRIERLERAADVLVENERRRIQSENRAYISTRRLKEEIGDYTESVFERVKEMYNSCDYCKEKSENNHIIRGKDIEINKCASATNLTEAQIMQNENDKLPGIVIYKGTKAMGYFDIKFCPICGRKLVEE